MARASAFVLGLVCGIALGTAIVVSHAQDPDDSAQVAHAAELAGVDPVDLKGAMLTTGIADPFVYLRRAGELENPPPLPPPVPVPPPFGVWDRLAQCESGGNWAAATGNGYFGGIQFDLPSWRAAGGVGRPDQASRAEQIRVGMNWQRQAGWRAWPVCSRVIARCGGRSR